MSIQERLLHLAGMDREAARARREEGELRRRQELRTGQSVLLELLRENGILGPIEEFIGERIPTIEEYLEQTRVWQQRYEEYDPTWGLKIIVDLPTETWIPILPGPVQLPRGLWISAVRLELVRYPNPRKYFPRDVVSLTYDGDYLTVQGEWPTLRAHLPVELLPIFDKESLERAVAEAVFNPFKSRLTLKRDLVN